MSSLEKQSALPCSSALTEVEEVRAKHQLMRDRLLARRQQREHLLAAAAVTIPHKTRGVQIEKSACKASLLAGKVPITRPNTMSLMMNSFLVTSDTRLTTGNISSHVKLPSEVDPMQDSTDDVHQKPVSPDNTVSQVSGSFEPQQCASHPQVMEELDPGEDINKINESSYAPTSADTKASGLIYSPKLDNNDANIPADLLGEPMVKKPLQLDIVTPDQVKRKRTSRTTTATLMTVTVSAPLLTAIPTTTDAFSKIHKSTTYPTFATKSDNSRSSVMRVHRIDGRHQQQRRAKGERRQVIADGSADEETVFRAELEDLLGTETAKEKENKRACKEILELLNTPTAKERYLSEKFRTQGGSQVQQFCSHGTRIDCSKARAQFGDLERCTKLHFRKIIHPHTDESLGDCSFLNTCFHVDTCKYVHYTIDTSDQNYSGASSTLPSTGVHQLTSGAISCFQSRSTGSSVANAKVGDAENTGTSECNHEAPLLTLYPPQWINCDIRLINMSVLGKFAVIMADPPWDIHMELPYGTMSDEEMRRMDIPCLQDDGYLFLWVTGRAMELGRECLRLWGYQRVDEIIWVKTNQLQRLIRTGRTGHWLNHGKEHCLVGVKGRPQGVNVGLDCDVIVSEVRETSHKPDEIYGIIERLSPGTRKLELFGRPHNLQPNWITLGNQLEGTYLVDPAVVERFKKQYPNGLETKTK